MRGTRADEQLATVVRQSAWGVSAVSLAVALAWSSGLAAAAGAAALLASVAGPALERRWGFPVRARLQLLAMLGLPAVLAAYGDVGAASVAAVALGLVTVLAGALETRRLAVGLWTGAVIAVYLGATGYRTGAPELGAGWSEAVLTFGLVPAGLILLARQSHEMTSKLEHALAISEVARGKLLRSNREMELAVAQSTAALGKLGTIVENLSQGLVAVSLEGLVELSNPALATLLDTDAVQLGERIEAAVPEALATAVRSCLQSGELVLVELQVGGRLVLGAASPIVIGAAVRGAVVLVRDITLDKEIDRMKSDFIATVSHEMRTPLTSVLGFTKLIRNQLTKRIFPLVPTDDARVERARDTILGNLDVVYAEGERLTALINDVLDLSKMESGQMVWDLQPHAPSALVLRAVDATRALLEAKPQLALVVDLPPDLPMVVADRDRILQVLINLISNAVKFTDAGPITTRVNVDGPVVSFSVRDSGVGIRPADRDMIFEKFRQVGDTLTDRPQGTGLGLPICREIIANHGGQIAVESELGAGSCFVFTLPRSEPVAA